jgi:hypothetical protein
MAGFTAVNIGMRIPGMQSKLKQLAELPLQVMMAAGTQADESSSTCQWQRDRLVVPTGRGYAKMYEPTFWQEWDPLDWCYGDFLY